MDRLTRFLPPELAARLTLLDAALRVVMKRAPLQQHSAGAARSYAQWLLMEPFLTEALRENPRGLEAIRWNLTEDHGGRREAPLGPRTDAVEMLATARTLTGAQGRRLAKGWRRLNEDDRSRLAPRARGGMDSNEFEWGPAFDAKVASILLDRFPYPTVTQAFGPMGVPTGHPTHRSGGSYRRAT